MNVQGAIDKLSDSVVSVTDSLDGLSNSLSVKQTTATLKIDTSTVHANEVLKSGNVCMVNVAITINQSASANEILFIVPQEYRPSKQIRGVCRLGTEAVLYSFGASGDFSLINKPISSGVILAVHTTYIK